MPRKVFRFVFKTAPVWLWRKVKGFVIDGRVTTHTLLLLASRDTQESGEERIHKAFEWHFLRGSSAVSGTAKAAGGVAVGAVIAALSDKADLSTPNVAIAITAVVALAIAALAQNWFLSRIHPEYLLATRLYADLTEFNKELRAHVTATGGPREPHGKAFEPSP